MSSTVGAYDAKTHLPRLLDEVEQGATVTITRHGRPVARLVGVRGAAPASADLESAFAAARAEHTLGLPAAEAVAVGRR